MPDLKSTPRKLSNFNTEEIKIKVSSQQKAKAQRVPPFPNRFSYNQTHDYARVDTQRSHGESRHTREPSFANMHESRRQRHSSKSKKQTSKTVNLVEMLLYDYAYILPDEFVRELQDLVSYDYISDKYLPSIPNDLVSYDYIDEKMTPITNDFINEIRLH